MDPHCAKTLVSRELYYLDKNVYLDYLQSGMELESYCKKNNFEKLYNKISSNILNIKLDDNNLTGVANKARGSDVLIGGPPCQAYSTIGRSRDPKRKKSDPRHNLFKVYLKLIDDIKPTFFVYENVMGLLTAKSEKGEITK
ncbi:MAG: hypothetical protein CMD68_00795, partial [Gammaproteobacteria bacterium]|nr:hypothetical protein [Gammaproteobacteria bacterium]